MTDKELTALVSKRGVVKWQLTVFTRYLATLTQDQVDAAIALALEMRCRSIENLQYTFFQIQEQIDFIVPDDERQDDERETVTNSIVHSLITARSLLDHYHGKIRAQATNSPAPSISPSQRTPDMQIKLPRMQLPTFNGTYSAWVEFRDMFDAIVHQNTDLSNIQKLYYLRSSLSGEAAGLIRSIQSSNDNYTVAWQLLLDRYDNNNLIIHNHIKSIFELPSLQKETAIGIRNIIDVVHSNLRSLKNLKQPTDSWDILVIYLITSKLDNNSRREWEEKRNSIKTAVSLDDLLVHLKSRCNILETLTSHKQVEHAYAHAPRSLTHKDKSHNQMQNNANFRTSHITTSAACNFCRNKNHFIYHCNGFLALSPEERAQKCVELKLCRKCLRTGHATETCRFRNCVKCDKSPNSLLHTDYRHPVVNAPSVSAHSHQSKNEVLLSTVQVLVKDSKGSEHYCRALLDSGSQTNFITEECASSLNLAVNNSNLTIYGINSIAQSTLHETHIQIRSAVSEYKRSIKCILLPRITQNLPHSSFNLNSFKLPSEITLADPEFNISKKIDLLLGAELFYELLCPEQLNLGKNLPTIQKTVLGWIVGGNIQHQYTSKRAISCVNTLENLLTHFWKLDSFNDNSTLTIDEAECENHFINTYTRASNGRFIVRIPFKENVHLLGINKSTAESRFFRLERALQNNPHLKQAYDMFMREYIDLNHMQLCENPVIDYFLPHHAVIKDTGTTKVRVVFDGSCKSDSGLSLNDTQLVGPVVQSSLFRILIKFRCHSYVLAADIKKMYRQVSVHSCDTRYQQILWRFNKADPLQVYTLRTVTYGTSAASFLATRSLSKLGEEHSAQYPIESKIITDDVYVDDILTGANSKTELESIKINLEKILNSGQFELHKWLSNIPSILNSGQFELHKWLSNIPSIAGNDNTPNQSDF